MWKNTILMLGLEGMTHWKAFIVTDAKKRSKDSLDHTYRNNTVIKHVLELYHKGLLNFSPAKE